MAKSSADRSRVHPVVFERPESVFYSGVRTILRLGKYFGASPFVRVEQDPFCLKVKQICWQAVYRAICALIAFALMIYFLVILRIVDVRLLKSARGVIEILAFLLTGTHLILSVSILQFKSKEFLEVVARIVRLEESMAWLKITNSCHTLIFLMVILVLSSNIEMVIGLCSTFSPNGRFSQAARAEIWDTVIEQSLISYMLAGLAFFLSRNATRIVAFLIRYIIWFVTKFIQDVNDRMESFDPLSETAAGDLMEMVNVYIETMSVIAILDEAVRPFILVEMCKDCGQVMYVCLKTLQLPLCWCSIPLAVYLIVGVLSLITIAEVSHRLSVQVSLLL